MAETHAITRFGKEQSNQLFMHENAVYYDGPQTSSQGFEFSNKR
jgi:hypothetical protein